MNLLNTADEIRAHLKGAAAAGRRVFAATEGNQQLLPALSAAAELFGFDTVGFRVRVSADARDALDPVPFWFVTMPREAITDSQLAGFVRVSLPGAGPFAFSQQFVGFVWGDRASRELLAFLVAADAGRLLTSAEQAARN